jgi:PAS domain S-box-containing protein
VVVDAVTKRFEEVNRAAQLLYGYSREEFLTLLLEDISAEQDKTRAKLESIRNGEMGGSIVYYRYFKKKDGTVFPGELSLATYASMGRQKIIGAVRDITERHQKEVELRQTKQRLQHILASNPAVIYSRNPAGDGTTTFISKNVKTELGYDPEDFVKDRHFWFDHIHPDDLHYVKDEFSTLEDRGSRVLEYRFRHKDGSYRWMRDAQRLLFEEQSNAVEVVGSCTDITDMKETEEALRASEQQFRDLIENSPIGISIFQDARAVYQNPEQMKINGPSSEKNIFQGLEKIFPDDLDKVKTAYRRILKGEVSTIEVDFRFFRSGPQDVKADSSSSSNC